MNNIFPDINRLVRREEKERMIKQKGKVIWMTGLSGSGKTTLALRLEKELFDKGYLTQIFDGDNIRSGINSDLNFTGNGRMENIRRVAEISKLFIECGIIVINCFISPTIEIRKMAKEIIGENDFVEIFIDTSMETCEKRDVKGLYKKARQGNINEFTGIDSSYENPVSADVVIKTDNKTVEESLNELLSKVLSYIEKV